MKSDSAASELKRRVGVEAARAVESGMVVALGTGSTAAFTLVELGRRVREEGLEIRGVATSFSATRNARVQDIPLVTLDEVERIDLAIDGADEVDPGNNLIKGGGAAHTQEKVIDSFADRFLVVVDDSKLVDCLGVGFALPIEVLPFAVSVVEARLKNMGAATSLRSGTGKDGPVVTDLGHLVIDAKFEKIADPESLDHELNAISGLVEHGLFVGIADEVLVGRADGSIERR